MNYAQQKNPTRSAIGFGLVVLVDVVLVYGLVNGLARKAIEVIKPPIETKIVEEVKPPPPDIPPPPPPPKLAAPPPPFIPPPEVQIQQPPPPVNNAIQTTTSVKPVEAVPVRPNAVAPEAPPAIPDSEVGAKPIDGSNPVYPPRLLAQGREGVADVECDVDVDGSTSNCTIISVTGGAAFGEATLVWVRDHKYHPRVRNGHAIKEEHHRFHVVYKLPN